MSPSDSLKPGHTAAAFLSGEKDTVEDKSAPLPSKHIPGTLWSVNHICKQTWASGSRKVSQEWQREKWLKADQRQNVWATRGEIPAVTRSCWQPRGALSPFPGSGLDTHFWRTPVEPRQASTALSRRAPLPPISKTANFIRWLLHTDAQALISITDFPKLSPAVHVKPQKLHIESGNRTEPLSDREVFTPETKWCNAFSVRPPYLECRRTLFTLVPTMTCRSPGTKSEQSAYSQSIVRIHCKVDLWTKAEPKTSYHTQNLARQMRHRQEWPLSTAVFSAGARRYSSTVLWPKCYLALLLRTFSTKNVIT